MAELRLPVENPDVPGLIDNKLDHRVKRLSSKSFKIRQTQGGIRHNDGGIHDEQDTPFRSLMQPAGAQNNSCHTEKNSVAFPSHAAGCIFRGNGIG